MPMQLSPMVSAIIRPLIFRSGYRSKRMRFPPYQHFPCEHFTDSGLLIVDCLSNFAPIFEKASYIII